MMSHLTSVGHALMKRAQGNWTLPSWAWLVFLIDAAVFLPVLLFIGYTLHFLYVTLAIVEDPNQSAYEPVSLNEDSESVVDDHPAAQPDGAAAEAAATKTPKPVTASLRATNRLLYSIGGWRSNFRGLAAGFTYSALVGAVGGVFSAFVPSFFGTLLASLALVQLSAVWVHIAIGQPQQAAVPFWRRLPPLRKTFEATCFPALLYWAASTLAHKLPVVLSKAMGLPVWSPKNPSEMPTVDGSASWKIIVIFLVSVAVQVLAVIPSHVVLVRVQASLMPPEEDAIVPFDRSFDGKVEPAIVGGKGYVTMKDALTTFPRASWIRLYVLYAKVFVVGILGQLLIAAVVVPEVLLMAKRSA